jgi:hypothetical protein
MSDGLLWGPGEEAILLKKLTIVLAVTFLRW